MGRSIGNDERLFLTGKRVNLLVCRVRKMHAPLSEKPTRSPITSTGIPQTHGFMRDLMKSLMMLAFVALSLGFANAQCKVYSGSTGYTVAARVDGGKVYSGPSGFTVVARFENGKVYSGSSGYNVMARVEGNKIYGGSSGHNVIGRIDGDKVYLGSTGYKVAARSEGCGGMSFAAAAAACCL